MHDASEPTKLRVKYGCIYLHLKQTLTKLSHELVHKVPGYAYHSPFSNIYKKKTFFTISFCVTSSVFFVILRLDCNKKLNQAKYWNDLDICEPGQEIKGKGFAKLYLWWRISDNHYENGTAILINPTCNECKKECSFLVANKPKKLKMPKNLK